MRFRVEGAWRERLGEWCAPSMIFEGEVLARREMSEADYISSAKGYH